MITGPSGDNPANVSGETDYTVTFSDTNLGAPISGTVSSGITINGSNSGCIKSVSGCTASACTVTITGCTTVTGTVSISVDTGAYSDSAGNAVTAEGPSSTFTVNNDSPTIAISSPATNTWINIASDSATFAVSGTCTEAVQAQLTGQTVTIKIDGATAGTTTCAANGTFSGTVDTTGLSEGAHSFTATVTDLASNVATSLTNNVTRDVTAPTVSITGPGGTNPAGAADNTTYTLTFSDTNLGTLVDNTINSGITIDGANSGCLSSVNIAANVATLTITGCNGNGNANITATSSAWTDQAGNSLTANGPSSDFTVSN